MVIAGFVGLIIGGAIVHWTDFAIGALWGYTFAWLACTIAVRRVFQRYRASGW